MPSDATVTDGGQQKVKECPFDDCDWSWAFDPDDQSTVEAADTRAYLHWEREHCGHARVRVVLEADVLVGSGQSLSEVLDHEHDRVAGTETAGYEVAYTIGELLDEPDGEPDDE